MAESCVDCWKDDRELRPATHEDEDDPVCYKHKALRCRERGDEPPPNVPQRHPAPPQNPDRTSTSISAPTSKARVDAKPGPANSAAGPGTRQPDSLLRNHAAGTDPGAAVHAPGQPARKESSVPDRPTVLPCSRGCGRPTHRGACAGQATKKASSHRGRPLGRDGLRELKPEEFHNLFTPRIGHDDWTQRVLDRIEALPLKKFYAVDVPKERSIQGFQNTLQRYFKGRAFKLRKFRGKGQNAHLMGIYKEPVGAQA